MRSTSPGRELAYRACAVSAQMRLSMAGAIVHGYAQHEQSWRAGDELITLGAEYYD